MSRKAIVLLFSDDSTLIFACRMREILRAADPNCVIQMIWFEDENALSYRQLRLHLPKGPDKSVKKSGLIEMLTDPRLGAIISSRIYRPMSVTIKRPGYRWMGNRPCIIGFLGGLDFFPEQGFLRRAHCDGVFLFPRRMIELFSVSEANVNAGWQRVDFGHPSVVQTPQNLSLDGADRSDIYFFTQAISPLTRRSRLHVLEMLAAIAQANPERKVLIKLRHLPDENQSHLHKEKYSYPELLSQMKDIPVNLVMTDGSIDDALATLSIGITCTSTAALDVVRAGLPCMVYLDYVDNYRDPLKEPMEQLFQSSNLITPLEDILNLKPRHPNQAWLNDMFCPPDLGQRVFDMIASFENRPVKVERYRRIFD